jgi:hypothetical protein
MSENRLLATGMIGASISITRVLFEPVEDVLSLFLERDIEIVIRKRPRSRSESSIAICAAVKFPLRRLKAWGLQIPYQGL